MNRPSTEDLAVWARHLANFGPLAAIGATALFLAFDRIEAPLVARLVYAVVVAINVTILAMASWSTVLGGALRIGRSFGHVARGPSMTPPTGGARTAILMAIHEEDAARVFAASRAMADDLARQEAGAFDVFVLSDTRSADGTMAEESMHALASRATGPRLLYRRRERNVGRKAGNIADFVRRWGAAYDFMIVLDADSLMTGACIARLVGAMEAGPSIGLIQAMCYPVGRSTLFSRIQQFDARILGPLFQAGAAFWQGPRGNFWGHNAIIRVSAFAACCGLPVLPGRPPLGGEMLSHDTVEAALMLRGGYGVWMLPCGPDGRPDGSWEETPTNLLDHLERDRRWLRGNLQHLKVLATDGLAAASIYHLVRGLGHFFYAPMLVAWLALYVTWDRGAQPDALLILFVALLAAPRLCGLAAALADRDQVVAVGGRGRLVASVLLDQFFAAMMYPVVLVTHFVDISGTLLGGELRWDAQARSERGLSWGETARRLVPAVGGGLLVLATIASVAPMPVLMLAPGLLCAVPLAVLTSRRGGGRLFEIPEDASPHSLRDEVASLEAQLRRGEPLDRKPTVHDLPPDFGLPMLPQVLQTKSIAGRR